MINKQRLLTPGPTPIPETVRLALAHDMIHHRKLAFKKIMADVQSKLKELFGTGEPVLPLASSGTGAMTAAVSALFSPGEKVVIVNGGKFGERWEKLANHRGLECHMLSIPWGQAVQPDQIAQVLAEIPDVNGVLMQQCETSTGVLMPVREIAALTCKSNALLVVDGISGVGISPAPMDKWEIDCLLTGSQKGLLLPPGLALIALSPRAWLKAEMTMPGCFYFDLLAERKSLGKNQTNFTSPVNLVIGLQAALNLLLKDGLEAIYRKQWALTMLVRTGVKALGLELFVQDNFAWGITSITMPPEVDAEKVLEFASSNFGVVMAGGQDRLKGKIVRLGHMGWVDWADCIAGLCALKAGIAACGGNPDSKQDFISAAMSAYGIALQQKPQID